MPFSDFDRLNYIEHNRWSVAAQEGKWHVSQDHEAAGCRVIIARDEDLRAAIDLAEEHGEETMQSALQMIANAALQLNENG